MSPMLPGGVCFSARSGSETRTPDLRAGDFCFGASKITPPSGWAGRRPGRGRRVPKEVKHKTKGSDPRTEALCHFLDPAKCGADH